MTDLIIFAILTSTPDFNRERGYSTKKYGKELPRHPEQHEQKPGGREKHGVHQKLL